MKSVGDPWCPSSFPEPEASSVERSLQETLRIVATRLPSAIAVVERDKVTNFSELVGMADELSRRILAADAPEGVVGVYADGGVEMVAAWFACSMANRTCVLLDPSHPEERNEEIVRRTGVTLNLRELAPEWTNPSDSSITGLRLDDPAFLFPTSGSTGIPKLVAHSARSLQCRIQASIQLFGVKPGERVVIAGSPGNFGFLHHALVFLLSGAGLCLVDIEREGVRGVLRAVDENGARHARFTPSLFRVIARLPEVGDTLRKLHGLRFSGEPLLRSDLDLAHAVTSPDCLIQNVYGSTEASLFIWSDQRGVAARTEAIPIGQVYPFSEYQIQDAEGRPVLPGDQGELVLSSRCHALGDWSDGGIDRSRFPDDPRNNGCRIYRSSDQVQFLEDHSLILSGRIDRIVKLNGRRVSLDEVEHHLRAMPGCTGAVVTAAQSKKGTRLTAYLVASDPKAAMPDPLRWLEARVPLHMVPGKYLWLPAIPLLPGGKVDHQRLLLLSSEENPHHVPSQNHSLSSAAEDLARIWKQALDSSDTPFDPDATFLSCGGDSLSFAMLQHEVSRRYGRFIDVKTFQIQPTFRGLANFLGISVHLDGDEVDGKVADDFTISFRLLREAKGASRGAVICMPGIQGRGPGADLATAGILEEYDFWECCLNQIDENIFLTKRWIRAAEMIAEQLSSGAGPRARIFIGFSLGGYVAWLVAGMLASSPLAPSRVICFDSIPMHRMRRYRMRESAEPSEWVTQGLIPTLHVLCSVPEGFRISYWNRRRPEWTQDEGLSVILKLSTYDHHDSIRRQTLSRISDNIANFVESGACDCSADSTIRDIQTPAGEISDILSGCRAVDADAVTGLISRLPGYGSSETLVALQYVGLIYGDSSEMVDFLERFISLHPHRHAPRYALLRLRRMEGCQPTSGYVARRSHVLPLQSFGAVDQALALRAFKKINESSPFDIAHSASKILDRVRAGVGSLSYVTIHQARCMIGRLLFHLR